MRLHRLVPLLLAVLTLVLPGFARAGQSTIFLNVTEGTTPECATPPAPGAVQVTADFPAGSGPRSYTVYLLGSGETPVYEAFNGLTGFQFGIEYTEHTFHHTGMVVTDWHYCSLLEWRPDNWPASGSGNTLTWSTTPNTCQREPVVAGGYFTVTVYGASTMSITPYPVTGLAKVANCSGAERVVEIPVGKKGLGWVAIGGALKNGEAGGCNPLVATCNQTSAPDPDQKSWSSIKNRFH